MDLIQQAMDDGYVTEQDIRLGRAVALRSKEYPNGELHMSLDMRKGYMLRPEKWRENADLSCQCQDAPGATPCNDPECFLAKPTRVPMSHQPGKSTDIAEPPRCTVNGEPVTELAVLVKPVAFFVTTNNGTHEVNRCYFQNGEFKYGVDITRIGGCTTVQVEYSTREGLRIRFDRGYEMFIPMSHCQGTWRTATE